MKAKLKETEESVYDWLDRIRPKPGLYMGARSLERLRAFLDGMDFGLGSAGLVLKDHDDFHRFHGWIAERLGFSEPTSGWYNMIRSKCADEAEALDRFYVLLDEFRAESKAAKAR